MTSRDRRSGSGQQPLFPSPRELPPPRARRSSRAARQGFDLDLLHGQAREGALAHTLFGARVEVKSDGRCRRTGNLFVEYRYRGRLSGVSVTTAERWAFEFDDDCWLIVPTSKVRELSRRALREGRRAVGGDDDASEGALVPIDWFTRRRI